MRSHTLTLIAGLATACSGAAHAQHAKSTRAVPARQAGVLYINTHTGERTLTRFGPNPKETVPDRPVSGARSSEALFDYWMALDLNPCWDSPGADGIAYPADEPDDALNGILEPVAGFDFGDLPFDSRISGIVITTLTLATESTDSNADGTPDTGIDTVAAFYDALSEANSTSVAPPTAVVRVESIPGQTDDDPVTTDPAYQIVLDFGGTHFELGDSDGLDRGDLWLTGAAPGYDVPTTQYRTPQQNWVNEVAPNGLADFRYLQYYTQHATDDKVTQDSTFIMLGTPEGEIHYTTVQYTTTCTFTCPSCTTGTCYTTLTLTYLVPDESPQARAVNEGIGLASLGFGADPGTLDTTLAGCCWWFGGLDCLGYLDQLQPDPAYNPSWYNFTPYAQNAMGLLSDTPPPNVCATIDFAPDGLLDNADIGGFIAAFVAGDPTADLNGDGVADNGDIGAFVQTFVACTG